MAKRIGVTPTRSNLLRLREALKGARAGHALLEHKREVLVRELLAMIEDADATDAEMNRRLQAAYQALFEARMRMGGDRLRWASLAPAAEIETAVTLRSIMGVPLPLVDIDVTTLPLPYSPGDTSAALDEARARWLAVAEQLGHLAESKTAVWRLAAELQKTQRRVNALEHLLIPQYEATLRAITEVLEEQERENFMRARRTKRQTGARAAKRGVETAERRKTEVEK